MGWFANVHVALRLRFLFLFSQCPVFFCVKSGGLFINNVCDDICTSDGTNYVDGNYRS